MDSSSSGGGRARRRSGGGGGSSSWGSHGDDGDPFYIPAKGAPVERLKKWRAAFRFKEAGRAHGQSKEPTVSSAVPHSHPDGALGFGIKEDQLTVLTRDHNYSALQQYRGISGVANMLKTDTEKGIGGDDTDLMARRNAFGSNTYPRKKGRSFLAFVWDACKDLTLIILMVAAAVSLALGITTEGIKEGWYDGASIAFAVLLVVFVTAISDYKQSLQFQNLNEEKQNIRLEVVRGGRRIMVSIYDLVVGDVVPLKIGDQVPADGILISGHSLSIDESSMTGESKIVHKDLKSPFLMSGCKVADGYGTMLVMGRSSPNDKLLLVKALRNRGHVVAVTGDGTNDAPALHEADIGLSMGIQGTEVAKESSDIIILDDNFASVVRVVRWGRSVYANIQKFIQFQLTVNVAAFIINVVAAVSSGNVPLNAVQLLWVNLIMDTLGALALATEPPTNHLMERPPVGRREPLVTNIMWRNLIIMALFQVSVLLTLNFKGISLLQLKNDDHAHADKVKNTFIFNTFVLCQVFNEFNSRKPDELNIFKGISGNHLFIIIVAVTVLLQALIVEFLGKFASTVKLSWQLWLVSIGLAFFSWPLAFVGKLIPVPKRPFEEFFACCCKGGKQASDDASPDDKATKSEHRDIV